MFPWIEEQKYASNSSSCAFPGGLIRTGQFYGALNLEERETCEGPKGSQREEQRDRKTSDT